MSSRAIEKLDVDNDEDGERVEWPAPLDLETLAATDPEPPRFVIGRWLPAGYATLLAGHGGGGKSTVAMTLAVGIAAGRDVFGLDVVQRSRVLYLSCEDRERVLHWRLRRICDHLDVDLADLADNLSVLDLVGHDSVVYSGDETDAFEALVETVESIEPDIIVVDGVSDVFGGNENDRGSVKRFVNRMISLIPDETGAVLLIHHVAKPTASNASTTEGYSGSTQWHNAARARWYLRSETTHGEDGERESTGDLLLELQKSNLGPSDQRLRLRWDDEIGTLTGRCEGAATRSDRIRRDEAEQRAIVSAFAEAHEAGENVPAADRGRHTTFHALSVQPSFPGALLEEGAARKRFHRHIDALRRNRVIASNSIRRTNRHPLDVYELSAPAWRGCAEYTNSSYENSTRQNSSTPVPPVGGDWGGSEENLRILRGGPRPKPSRRRGWHRRGKKARKRTNASE